MPARAPRNPEVKQRLHARNQRIHKIRVRAAAAVTALFLALCGLISEQLASAQTSTQTTAQTSTQTTATTATQTQSATQSSSATPVTTRQS